MMAETSVDLNNVVTPAPSSHSSSEGRSPKTLRLARRERRDLVDLGDIDTHPEGR
jgi:hypothetical protein